MAKVEPMLLNETYDKEILKDDSKWFQIKENGVRAIVHVKDGKIIGIRNRTNNPILYQFPELREIKFPFDTAILDGEICVFDGERSVFYGGIDKRRSAPNEKTLNMYPARLVVFDVLKMEDEVLVMKPYKYRYETIARKAGTFQDKHFKLALNYNGQELWDRVVKENLEGVVIKNPMAMYELGKRSSNFIKLKNYKTADVIVEKTEPNEKGTKIYGKLGEIEVECQLAGVFDVEIGSAQTIKYLDISGNKLIQPTKVKRQQIQSTSVIN